MAKASFYLDMRAVKPGQPGPLKVRYSHKGSAIFIPTSVNLTPEQWMDNTIISHPRAKQWNNMLRLRMADITSTVLELEVTGKLSDMSAAELKRRLLESIGHETKKEDVVTFLSVFEEKVSRFDNEGTISIWRNTLGRIKAYCEDAGYRLDTLTFEQMNREWLEGFDSFMAKTAPRANARGINHRNIKATFNYAIKVKKMAIPYPFQEYKIKKEDTRHQDLTIEQVRLMKDYELDERIGKCRDIFMLMIYLRGINAADLFGAKKTQIINGRLEYYRRKTGAFTSVKIEPEAQAIIDRYSGKEYILDIAERWSDPKNYLRRMDKDLKKIGPVTIEKKGKKTYHSLFQKVSSNGARHTWASLLGDLGYSIDIASEGLTHKYGYKTTNIYMNKRYQKNVDKATRHLIDYILDQEDVA